MTISCIVAVARNNVIGKDNKMPWHLPADLAYFRKVTMGHHIILGRKNFEAIGRPLPGRTNVILTRDDSFACSNCMVVHSMEKALQYAFSHGENEAFIIGGGSVYKQSMAYWDKLYLTEIDLEVEGDVFFPQLDFGQWDLISETVGLIDEKNIFPHRFRVFIRK